MIQLYVRRISKILALLIMTWLVSNPLYSQVPNCDGTVPTFNVDYVNNLGGTFVTPSLFRNGHCCSANGSDDCLDFVINMDSNTAGVSFGIVEGAQPSGSMYYQIDCGPQVVVGVIGCITTPGTHYVTFCKPGNNENRYALTSIPRPTFRDDTVAIGCYDTLPVFGLKDAQATYTSIFPGAVGAYNNYISCTSGCGRVRFTPDDNAPTIIKYRVCGFAIAANCVGNQMYCDTITVVVAPRWSNVPDKFICAPSTTASAGSAPTGAVWRTVPGNPAAATIDSVTGAISGISLEGTYKFVLIGNNKRCTDTIQVIKGVKPKIGTDQTFCQPQSTTNLGAAPSGFTWAALSGNPSAATVGSSTGAVTGMTNAGTYLFALSS